HGRRAATLMTDDQSFLDAIIADPDNLTLRLVYADYLEDKGDPRADFIRVRCALEEMDEYDERRPALEEQELRLLNTQGRRWIAQLEDEAHGAGLLHKHGKMWYGNVELDWKPYKFRRGFVW